jgi:hypothetical protein
VPFPQRDVELRAPELAGLLRAFARQALPGFEDPTALLPQPQAAEPLELPPPMRPDEWSEERLVDVVARLRAPDGVTIRDRRHLLTTHHRCFVGSEAVRWLMERESLSRAEAIAVGRRLVAVGLVHHVLDEHGFEDGWLFYRFFADETPGEEAAALPR